MSFPDPPESPVSRPHPLLHVTASAALFGAAVVLVGCDESPTENSTVNGQFEVEQVGVGEVDRNELPASMTPEDDTKGDANLGDATEDRPNVTEYDTTPLAPGETDE